jgi:hypothetical protein
MVTKIYEVREYDEFPLKKPTDLVVRTYEDFKTASFESRYLNRKYDTGRFYVMDQPHTEVVLTKTQRAALKANFNLE